MCGIAGIVDFGGLDGTTAPALVEPALARLAPRGPDGRGVWADGRCVLGHTRLAVIDLSAAAAQPMARDGRVITFNGEIYNFAALRDELRGRGHRFTTRSDTEVLLVGWRAWGPELLDRLAGMFAFAIWDPERGALVLARDRFGKKPLLFAHAGRRLAFASDLAALGRLGATAGAIDPTALRLLFALRYIPEPWSIDAAVRKLPSGHLAEFTDGRLEVRRWYDLAARRPARYRREEEAIADVRSRFDAAVAERLVADVPVGAFLSGGLDSALVAAALAAQNQRVRTFTVGFPGAAAYYEERPAARTVARHLGVEHTEIEVGPDEALRALDAVFDGLDEPFADSSAIPTFLLCRETRRHVTVALSGDGADEVFGGYRRHVGEAHAGLYRRLPRWLRDRCIVPLAARLPEGKHSRWRERARRLRRFVDHAGKDPLERHAGWVCQLADGELDRLFVPHAGAVESSPSSLMAALRAEACEDDPINAVLATDLSLVLPGDMLVKVDRMSMANSLEVRCPFLDHRLVECAAAMPGSFKLKGRVGKRILRRAFADRLPPEVFARPKKGFEVPIASWLVGELRDLTRAALDPVRLQRQGLFRADLPQRWFADLESGRRDTAEPLWTLVAFQAWAERQGKLRLGA